MICDLKGKGSQEAGCHILIIGGGTAGLTMAEALCGRGLKVICLESGGTTQDGDTHPLNAVEQTGVAYAGAESGRFRCIGGTSTRWGGALIPFQPADMIGGNWPVSAEELSPYVDRVEALFDLPDGPYLDYALLPRGDDFVERLAKWPPFANRNVFNLCEDRLRSDPDIEIWLNATATEFRLVGDSVNRVTARSADGSRLDIAAYVVIFAAGAIETTRLLLIADQQNEGFISKTTQSLGRYFHDHLSCAIADLEPIDRTLFNNLVGFRFGPRGQMRNSRFELSEASSLRGQHLPCFAHVAARDKPGGFQNVRKLYQAAQKREIPSAGLLLSLVRDTPWLFRAMYWRFIRSRLLYPPDAQFQLHLVTEQVPLFESAITLSQAQRDAFGLPLASIHWVVSDKDKENMIRSAHSVLKMWSRSTLATLAVPQMLPSSEIENAMASGAGIYHPGGSTRMSPTPQDGVVDHNLGLHPASNVFVVSTSALPTGGGANPTMTLLALALRCVDHLLSLDVKARTIPCYSGNNQR